MSTFSVAMFAEAWEYGDEGGDAMIEDKYADPAEDQRFVCTSSRTAPRRSGKVKSWRGRRTLPILAEKWLPGMNPKGA